MTERTMRLRLGVFVLAAIVGLTGLVMLFGGAPDLFTRRTKYVVTFPEAPGIATGTPVRKSGVRVGEVTGVGLDDETGLVKVNVQMDGSYLPRPSDEATITRGLLSGDTALDFVPRPGTDGGTAPKADPYPPGEVIKGVPPINPRTLLNEVSGVIPTTQGSLIRLSTSFQRFEQTAPKAERAFDEVSALARAAREIVPEFRQTNIRLQELIGVDDPTKPVDPTAPPTLRVALRELTELLRSIRPAADEIAATLKDSGPEFNRTIQSVRRTSESVNDLLNPENRKVASATLKNLEAGSGDLTKTIRLAAILLDGADKTLRELNGRLAQSEALFANLNRVTKPAADNADQIVTDVAETVRTINTVAAELARVIGDLKQANRGEGSLQKVLSDPSLYNNLNDAALSTSRLLARTERIAADLQVFADKIARKPETIGLGGVMHPSTGLKESPNAPLPPSTPLIPYAPAPGPRVPPAFMDPAMVPAPSAPSETIAPIPPLPREGAMVPVPAYKPVPLPATDRPSDLPPR